MTPIICPTITATDKHQYRTQMEIATSLTSRVHIDLMDGQLAPSLSPPLSEIWLDEHTSSDIHLMYKWPMNSVDDLIRLKPSLVIIHSEADVDHNFFFKKMHDNGINCGIALLKDTRVEALESINERIDHVLIFSGNLGFHGGVADLNLLSKVVEVKEKLPNAEISWDGGVNDKNAKELITGGINVLNVGGFIQNSTDPLAAYAKLEEIIQG